MTSLNDTDRLTALRCVVFGAVESWNAAHPHPRRSRQERASLNVTQIFGDTSGLATYSITLICTLAGAAPLTFHGQNLAGVAEHAQLTLERKIVAELERRAQKDEVDRNHKVAI